MKSYSFLAALTATVSCTSPAEQATLPNDAANNSAHDGGGDSSRSVVSGVRIDAGSDAQAVPNTPSEPYISQFSYWSTSLAYGNFGVTAFYREGHISKSAAPGSGNFQLLPPEVAEEFILAHLGPLTMRRMREGWGCSAPDPDGPGFDPERVDEFHARIQDNGSTTEIQDITGCVDAEDPTVMDIIDALKRLELLYL